MTVVEFWKALFTVGRPRRVSALSMTSSWTSVAVCSSSTDAASGTSRSRSYSPKRPASRARAGRRQLAAAAEHHLQHLAERAVVDLLDLVEDALDERRSSWTEP